jgi:hypothetical protein
MAREEVTFKMRYADNGIILSVSCPWEDDAQEFVCQTDMQDEHDAFQSLFYTVLDYFGPSDSKYSEKRLYISVLPGLDHSDFEKKVKETFYIY